MRTIDVCVGNYGYYTEGELRDKWISLPKTNKEIKEFLTSNGLLDNQHEEIYISDYDGLPFNFPTLFDEYTHLDDLNLLAMAMQQNPVATKLVEEFGDYGFDDPGSIMGLINWILQSDEIAFYPYDFDRDWNSNICQSMNPDEKLGYQIASDSGLLGKLEDLGVADFFDFESYGECYGQDYIACETGYYDATQSMPDEDWYTREEIIEMLM